MSKSFRHDWSAPTMLCSMPVCIFNFGGDQNQNTVALLCVLLLHVSILCHTTPWERLITLLLNRLNYLFSKVLNLHLSYDKMIFLLAMFLPLWCSICNPCSTDRSVLSKINKSLTFIRTSHP